MRVLSRWFFLAGAVPYLVLGAAHALLTPHTLDERKGLSPADPALREAMARGTVLLTRRTDVWRAWVGFNLSHSLGALLFGCFVVFAGRSDAVFAVEGGLFGTAALLVSGAYLALALKFWFRTPIIGTAVSFALFLAAWVLLFLGR
jgi:hypothetical protein